MVRKAHLPTLALLLGGAVALAGCTTSPKQTAAANKAPLAGSRWRLASIQSMDDAQGTVTPDEPAKYTLEFGTDGQAAFRLDCNRGRTSWTAQASEDATGGLEFGPLAMTRAMCAPESLSGRLAAQLADVRSYRMQEGRLFMSLKVDGGIIGWDPDPHVSTR